MNPKHKDPTSPNRVARAPYNFVPLPEAVVPAPNEYYKQQDTYQGNTGYIDCEIETVTPLYIRGGIAPEDFDEVGDKPFNELTDAQKQKRAEFFHTADPNCPVIPGSSLRGMVRMLVEIAAFGKMQFVGNETKLSYRAVAAPTSDPLSEPYHYIVGRMAANVSSGYLLRQDNDWWIHPAQTPQSLGLIERSKYLKIKNHSISSGSLPGLMRFNDPHYHVQYHDVSFGVETRQSKNGSYSGVIELGPRDLKKKFHGVLICSGNMKETGGETRSPRRSYAIVLEADPKAKKLKINSQAVKDYVDSLTDFQKKKPFSDQWGVLAEGRPVFYVDSGGGEVIFFGHTPNFRVLAWLKGDKPHTATALDFLPKNLRGDNPTVDFAEAIFGRVPMDETESPAWAGRVSFEDAYYTKDKDGIWFFLNYITPKILAAPKITTFQHYLTQDRPNDKANLNHYATSSERSALRGHKLYWRRRGVTRATIEARPEDVRGKETQYTGIKPVKPGVTFKCRIRFENLSDEELGALLWVLRLPEDHVHALGMGKPLGMGSVRITPTLVLSNRAQRYAMLFDDKGWALAEQSGQIEHFVAEFEKYVFEKMNSEDRKTAKKLADVERIQHLLCLLKQDAIGDDKASYMTIEPNQYKDRRVLPTPLEVINKPAPDFSGKPPTPPTAPVSTSKPKVDLGVNDRLTGKVDFLDDNGDVYFVPDKYPDKLARIRQSELPAQHLYREGSQIVGEVITIETKEADVVAECRLAPKKKKP